MTYKDALENRKNARKLAQHQQEQPAKLGIAPAAVELGKEALPTLSR